MGRSAGWPGFGDRTREEGRRASYFTPRTKCVSTRSGAHVVEQRSRPPQCLTSEEHR
jgi:hypothetical protein